MENTGIKRILFNIWPSIYKAMNGAFYYILQVIRRTVKLGINQIKNG
jgi:hypothetical protein